MIDVRLKIANGTVGLKLSDYDEVVLIEPTNGPSLSLDLDELSKALHVLKAARTSLGSGELSAGRQTIKTMTADEYKRHCGYTPIGVE